jgi:hypothetical protein
MFFCLLGFTRWSGETRISDEVDASDLCPPVKNLVLLFLVEFKKAERRHVQIQIVEFKNAKRRNVEIQIVKFKKAELRNIQIVEFKNAER